jgi:hypothetical protein
MTALALVGKQASNSPLTRRLPGTSCDRVIWRGRGFCFRRDVCNSHAQEQ